MADIWKARVDGPGGFHKSLAIKRILPDLVENREFLRMFADEAKLVASLSHPNIVQVLDFGHVGKHDYFIAMEYVAGVNLARLLNRAFETTRLPPELAITVIVEAARGLGHAHTRMTPAGEPLGIIHRDVSPQNILLSFSGEVKLTDFGIARVSSAISRTAVGHVRGKVAYMSPEQAAADPSRPVDVRSDLFSLGIILYEMITGRRLFPGGASPENHARVITFQGLTTEELAPVPPALRPIVAMALQGKPDDRFQDAQSLESELTNALGADVLVAGRQFISSLLPRLFPEEFRSEKEEDAELVPKTNAQISMADVDAIDRASGAREEARNAEREPIDIRRAPRQSAERTVVGEGAGVIPEPVTGGDTVVSGREPSEVREPAPSVSVSVSITANAVTEDDQDPEHTRLPADPEQVLSALTLAPPVAAPPERSTRTGFDEPLYPPRPPPPKWIAPALIAGGALLGIPIAMLLVSVLFWAVSTPEPEPTPVPTPMPMVSPTPSAEPDPESEAATPLAVKATPAPVATPASTPRSLVAARTPVSTPMPAPTTEPEPDPDLGIALMGILRINGSKPCDVFVDRSKVSEATPFERELSPGKHTIGFVHKASGLWLEQVYEIPAGQSLELFVDVDQATVRVR